jgi:hypothetical protein
MGPEAKADGQKWLTMAYKKEQRTLADATEQLQVLKT